MRKHIDRDKVKLMEDPTALTPWHPIFESIFQLDLTEAHTNVEVVFAGGVSITIITVGAGTWNFSLDHRTNVKYLSTWFNDMDLILREFNRIYFTNTLQDPAGPLFLIGQRLRPVTPV